jgi:hypothetical protein
MWIPPLSQATKADNVKLSDTDSLGIELQGISNEEEQRKKGKQEYDNSELTVAFEKGKGASVNAGHESGETIVSKLILVQRPFDEEGTVCNDAKSSQQSTPGEGVLHGISNEKEQRKKGKQ